MGGEGGRGMHVDGGALGSRETQLIVMLDVVVVRELSIRFHRKQIANYRRTYICPVFAVYIVSSLFPWAPDIQCGPCLTDMIMRTTRTL